MDPLDALNIDSLRASQASREAAEDEVGQSNFLQMLVAQLENQDPLNPQDSADFAAQLAQFSTVEQLIGVRSGVDELVSLGGSGVGSGDVASRIDPTNLVGRDVVVYGSQIEIDPTRAPVSIEFRTIEALYGGEAKILDENGTVVWKQQLLSKDPTTGQPVPLGGGDHTFTLDPSQANLPEGIYAIEFSGTGVNNESVTILPMIQGMVSGAILTGNPSIRIGSKIFALSDILEVKLAEVKP